MDAYSLLRLFVSTTEENKKHVFLIISGAERRSKIAMTPVFQGSHRRVIGISFQPAINAPRLGLIGHVIASAQS